jgi:hypothetical protein
MRNPNALPVQHTTYYILLPDLILGGKESREPILKREGAF